ITCLAAAISAVCSGVKVPCQPNIFVTNEPRWSKGRIYRGLSKPRVFMMSPSVLDFESFATGEQRALVEDARWKISTHRSDLGHTAHNTIDPLEFCALLIS